MLVASTRLGAIVYVCSCVAIFDFYVYHHLVLLLSVKFLTTYFLIFSARIMSVLKLMIFSAKEMRCSQINLYSCIRSWTILHVFTAFEIMLLCVPADCNKQRNTETDRRRHCIKPLLLFGAGAWGQVSSCRVFTQRRNIVGVTETDDNVEILPTIQAHFETLG